VDAASERQATEVPSPDAVARRAYERYVARGCEDGYDLDDWLQAEEEIRSETGQRMNAD